ncbi:hypothetical protein [Bacillus suaedaesalsae]|uniref:Uncharacterized protein n=1 Tax=Bacillus suaedaesalsae TaxID=2810349 RepID=A0ABS2DFQ5_9BACI|nr:hypothetical protein [Bacillus suaedaesalsae]MBM6617279.1 hypothetical protein [Bacillus suaedaesalsae]
MKHLVVTFQNLVTDLDQVSSRLEWTESLHLVSVTYRDKVGSFIHVIKNPTYLAEINNTHISVEVKIGTNILYDQQFIDKYEMKILEDDQVAEVTISFNKEISLQLHSNVTLFFNIDSFLSEWSFNNLSMVTFFKNIDKEKQVFIYLPTDEKIENPFLKVIPFKDYNGFEPNALEQNQKDLIDDSIKIREEHTRISTSMPVPYYFYFESSKLKFPENLYLSFQQSLFFLSLLHISNKYENEVFIVRGQKSVEYNWQKDFKPNFADILYSIFNFCYGKEQAQDKLEIGRNILTTYHLDESIDKLDAQLDKIEKTINRHFSLYVNDKIKKFLDESKKAIDEAHKYAKETREAADKVVSNINTSIIGLITAVFSGIVIMARGNKWFLIVALLLHMFYFGLTYFLNRYFAKKKQKEILDVYDQSIGYISNVTEEEKVEIKQMYIDSASESIDNNLKIYKWLSNSLVVLMLLLSIVVFFFMPNLDSAKKQSEQQNIKQEQINKGTSPSNNEDKVQNTSEKSKQSQDQAEKNNSKVNPTNSNTDSNKNLDNKK